MQIETQIFKNTTQDSPEHVIPGEKKSSFLYGEGDKPPSP